MKQTNDSDLKVGNKYLTKKGRPVIYLGVNEKKQKIVTVCETSTNINVEPDYPLFEYESKEEKKDELYKGKTDKIKVSGLIDNLLLQNKYKIKDISKMIAKQVGKKEYAVWCEVFTRLSHYRRQKRYYKVEKIGVGEYKITAETHKKAKHK